MVHSDPHYAHGFAIFGTTTGELWLRYALYEMLHVARFRVQAEGAVTHARVPYRPVTVNKEACYLVANHLDGFGLLSVGKGHNLARLSACKDVIAVGSQSRDVLVHEVAVTLQCVVRHIDTAHTFVSAYPQVVVVALYDAVYCQLAGRNQLMFHAVTVQS